MEVDFCRWKDWSKIKNTETRLVYMYMSMIYRIHYNMYLYTVICKTYVLHYVSVYTLPRGTHKHSFPIYSDCLFLFSCHIPVPFSSVGRPSCRLPCSIQASLHHYPGRGAATVLYVACNWTWEQLVSAPKTSQEKYIGRLLLHALPSVVHPSKHKTLCLCSFSL